MTDCWKIYVTGHFEIENSTERLEWKIDNITGLADWR